MKLTPADRRVVSHFARDPPGLAKAPPPGPALVLGAKGAGSEGRDLMAAAAGGRARVQRIAILPET